MKSIPANLTPKTKNNKWHPKVLSGESIYTQELFKWNHDNPTRGRYPVNKIEENEESLKNKYDRT